MAFRVALCVLTMSVFAAQAQAPQTFGDGVTLKESTPIVRLLDNPAEYEGKTVRVEGTVEAVCQHMGCWMAFAADGANDGRTLLIKVDDGVIVFPVSAKGHRAAAQGVVQRIGPHDAEGREAASEHAKQSAAPHDARTIWQLKATGAVVY